VRHFGQTTMTLKILADTYSEFDDLSGCLFGKSKVRISCCNSLCGVELIRNLFFMWSCNVSLVTCHTWRYLDEAVSSSRGGLLLLGIKSEASCT
jgi:hypothetical protein